jgi:hypothetical protein
MKKKLKIKSCCDISFYPTIPITQPPRSFLSLFLINTLASSHPSWHIRARQGQRRSSGAHDHCLYHPPVHHLSSGLKVTLMFSKATALSGSTSPSTALCPHLLPCDQIRYYFFIFLFFFVSRQCGLPDVPMAEPRVHVLIS